MDDELCENSRPFVAQSTVPQDQMSEVLEFNSGEVSSQGGLHAFLTLKSDTHIRYLDHGHIIPTVTHTGNTLLGIMLDLLGHHSFLCG